MDLLQDFIIISAAVTWNSWELVEHQIFLKLNEVENNLKIYHIYGDQEISSTQNSNIAIRNIITELELEKLDYVFSPIEDANHYSVLLRVIYDGLFFYIKNKYCQQGINTIGDTYENIYRTLGRL